jgi:hypothetical protein
MSNYNIFVIFHKYLLDNCYLKDNNFKKNNFIFIKCNELFEPQYNKDFGYNIIFEKNFDIYNSKLQDLNKPYMAVSAIYHIYKNKIYNNLNYIGFIEYDLSLESDPVLIQNNPKIEEIQKLKNIKSINNEIEKQIKNNKRLIIILSGRHRFKSFFNQNTIIDGKNLFYKIIDEFNTHFNTNHSVNQLLEENPVLGDQQSFLCDIKTFEIIMEFISYIIENKKVEYNGLRPSFLLARYFGVILHLLNIPTKLISLKHLNKHEW